MFMNTLSQAWFADADFEALETAGAGDEPAVGTPACVVTGIAGVGVMSRAFVRLGAISGCFGSLLLLGFSNSDQAYLLVFGTELVQDKWTAALKRTRS